MTKIVRYRKSIKSLKTFSNSTLFSPLLYSTYKAVALESHIYRAFHKHDNVLCCRHIRDTVMSHEDVGLCYSTASCQFPSAGLLKDASIQH